MRPSLYSHLQAEEPALGWTAKLPPQLEERGRRAWVTTHDNRVSSWQRAVAELLWSEGLEAELEHATEDGLFAVDVALPKQRVAVEVGGWVGPCGGAERGFGVLLLSANMLV